MNEIIDNIKEEIQQLFSNSKGCHDWDHTLRVYNICLHIGKIEDANMELLEIAALLHDIGRDCEAESKGKICHAEIGAKMAIEILKKYGLIKENINKICHCIETHRFRKTKAPESIEAKILFDADKLDAIGAIGIGRAFVFSGEVGARVHDKNVDITKTSEYTKEDTAYREFLVKLQHIKNRMQTEEGKKIAEERHQFMVEFFDRLNKEVDGNI